ncbi:uncharacterized protein CELE_D1081.10 [Caenorhabditis elegans]|uniref:Uncharacterized protein n=1 Tax=Caenorhabditis elegans TaxID=6239 RepID=A7LPH7_CAEEL|nr:Uncharacterized protein CELE_D1081.10 [Caenorhabditis elegans]CAO82023.2 Uncharacterized protein CELE_D1081.10 [Caenorhabditis elegans]|eukprot:NP_001122436.2 Uncharacterized protein CELE_D1081.10 [Caenorhabditis elegans]
MKFLIILITLLLETICYDSKFRLSHRENEIRYGSCGEPMAEPLWLASLYTHDTYETKLSEMKKPPKSRYSQVHTTTPIDKSPLTTQTSTQVSVNTSSDSSKTSDNSTVSTGTAVTETPTKKREITTEIPPTNAVFISQTHVLTSSSWFIKWKKSKHTERSKSDSSQEKESGKWTWKSDETPVNSSICETDRSANYHTNGMNFRVLDSRQQWKKVEEIHFLRYCEFVTSQVGFLTLLVVNRSVMSVPVVCLPKDKNKIRLDRTGVFGNERDHTFVDSVRK